MLNEQNVMKIFQFELKYEVFWLGKSCKVRFARIITNVLITVALVSELWSQSTSFQVTIFRFVWYLVEFTFCITLVTYIVNDLVGNEDIVNISRRIPEIDAQMNTDLALKKDWTLTLLSVVYIWTSLVILAIGCRYDFVLVTFLPIVCEILSSITMKHFIKKRLRHVRTAEEFVERINDAVIFTRQLLDLNTKINKTLRTLSFGYVTYFFQLVLYSSYYIWIGYGAGLEITVRDKKEISLTILWTSTLLLSIFLMAISSSFVADEVEEIKIELDISKTARRCTERERRQIAMFLMELSHTPVHLSALDFFDIEKSGLATACTTAISYLLVLIQFS